MAATTGHVTYYANVSPKYSYGIIVDDSPDNCFYLPWMKKAVADAFFRCNATMRTASTAAVPHTTVLFSDMVESLPAPAKATKAPQTKKRGRDS